MTEILLNTHLALQLLVPRRKKERGCKSNYGKLILCYTLLNLSLVNPYKLMRSGGIMSTGSSVAAICPEPSHCV